MAEPKPLASLSASLLARKGTARPAMRRQAQALGPASAAAQEDLGWNDMGYDVDPQPGEHGLGRSFDHGLSPMGAAQPVGPVTTSEAFEALGEALDRAVAQIPSRRAATIQPLDAAIEVPESAAPPAVREHQLRLEQALLAGAAPTTVSPDAVAGVPADALDAIRSAITGAPLAASPAAADARGSAGASRTPRARSDAGAHGKFAFTLRLDPQRHLRLRLASATSNRSAQQIIVQLIDEFLATLPEIDAFAAQVPASTTDY